MSAKKEENALCHPEEHERSRNIPSLDSLQAALFYLTTQYTVRPCPCIARGIVDHLARLCDHPHSGLIPAQRQVFLKLITLWRSRLPHPGSAPETSLH